MERLGNQVYSESTPKAALASVLDIRLYRYWNDSFVASDKDIVVSILAILYNHALEH